MTKKLRVALAQLNFTVGDLQGNLTKSIQAANHARDVLKADLIVFPELNLTGYPAEDLLLRNSFLAAANAAVDTFKNQVTGIYCIIGHPHVTSHGLHNSCSVIYNDVTLGRYAKQHLPNYGVFDEQRYFIAGSSSCIVPVHGIPVGVLICEDLWYPHPLQQIANEGARIAVVLNASPFEMNKQERRDALFAKQAKTARIPIVYVNGVAGQDDLIFDGGSCVINEEGNICQHAGFFQETVFPIDIEISSAQTHIATTPFTLPSVEQRVYSALVLAVKDYVEKNNFPGVLLGVSGGIDSALTLAIAVDALGKDKVHAVMLPSRYTSAMSMEDSAALIKKLGVTSETISIEPTFTSFMASLASSFHSTEGNITEQNLQARCRGTLLMALSNQLGYLVLTTGNRSELAVGYCTLYGDMAGGFDVLKDIPKTLVYRLADFRNQQAAVIPSRILTRAPTAELAPGQKDQDSLPAYAILDEILELYLNQGLGLEEIIAAGFTRETTQKIITWVSNAEYKRRQAPVGPRINHKAFGRDWRYPITAKFKS